MDCCQKAMKVDYSLSVLRLYEILVEHYVVAHSYLGSWYKVPEVFHQVHLFLGITLENVKDNITPTLLENSSGLNSTPREAFPFFTTGKVRGHVKYIHASRAGEGSESLNRTIDLYSEAIEQQLEYIQTQSTTTGRLYITSATDLVQPFGGERRAYATIHRSRLGYRKEYQSTLDSMKERLHISQHRDQIESRGPVHAFDDQLESLCSALPDHCSIAFDETGLMILVPSSSEVGDLVCQFKESNIILIIRPRQDGKAIRHKRSRQYIPRTWPSEMLVSVRSRPVCELIGRAVSLIPCSPSRPAEHPGHTNDLFRLENTGETDDMACLSLDTYTLQLLTAVSKSPFDATP
jgi:hypothetical protein